MAEQEDIIQVLRDALQAEEGWEYGDLLPIRTKGTEVEFGMPSTVRDMLAGLVDLLEGTKTGEVTGRGLMALTGLGAGAGMQVPKNALGMFAGKMARNAPTEDIIAANELLKGAPESTANKVWNVLGVGRRFADQEPRWEISEEGMGPVSGWRNKLSSGKSIPLSDVMQHPELFANYPALRDVRVKAVPGEMSYWNPNDIEIGLAERAIDPSGTIGARNALTHEVQHGVDFIEGFARGSSPQEFMRTYPETSDKDTELIKKALARSQYLKTAGEVMARLTEKRLDYPNFARRQIVPWSMMDYPLEEQLLLHPEKAGVILDNKLFGASK